MNRLTIRSLIVLLGSINLAYASPIFTITPSENNIYLRSDGMAEVQWTVTNNTTKTTSITVDPSYSNKPSTATLENDGCTGSSLVPSSSCTFTTLMQGSVQNASFQLVPRVCGFNGVVCSIPAPVVQVNFVSVASPAYAYIGTTGGGSIGGSVPAVGSLVPINASSDTLGTPLTNLYFNGQSGVTVSTDGSTIYSVGIAPSNDASKVETVSHPTLYVISRGNSAGAPQLLSSLTLPAPPSILSYLARVPQSFGSRLSPINGQSSPTYLAVAPNNKTVYVGGISRFIYVVDVENSQSPRVSLAISISTDPVAIYGMVLNPSGTMLYVAHDNGISVINTATNEVESEISIDGTNFDIAITPDGKTLYVTNDSDHVFIIDTDNFGVGSLAVGASPTGVAISPDGTKAYVTNSVDRTVSVIDTSTYDVESIQINGGDVSEISGIAIAPDGTKAFVVTDVGVAIIDLSNNMVTYPTVASPNLSQFGNFVG